MRCLAGRVVGFVVVGFALLLIAVTVGAATVANADEPISLRDFRDGIRHWKSGQNTDGYAVYRPEQCREIADNLLLYQRANGGWPPNVDPTRILDADERKELEETKSDLLTTSFDNRTSYPQVVYLAHVYARTGEPRYREAAERGIEFILSAQYDNGGFPHSFPRTDAYRPHITIVDDVMTGVLTTLRQIHTGEPPFDFLSAELQQRVAGALQRGEACLLALQLKVDGQLTGWASQYDRRTLKPIEGRSYELPALVSSETVGVLEYLMDIENPSPEVKNAIHAGVAWLERSQIHGLRIEEVEAAKIRYKYHTSTTDVIAVEDPAAPPLWARFYEIETNRPFMANRDGTKVYRLAEVERERRTGYSWYGKYANSLLKKEYPAWKQRWESQ